MDQENDELEYPFVGREEMFTRLEEAWDKYRIFGLYGLRSVGKSRTIQEFLHRRSEPTCRVLTVDMRFMKSMRSFHRQICAQLGILPEEDEDENIFNIFGNVFDHIKSDAEMLYVFVFDNTEDVIEGQDSQFLSICQMCVKSCRNVKIFLTSTSHAQFAQLRRAYFSLNLEPLTVKESVDLLKIVAPTVDCGQHEEKICELCCGLPLALMIVGAYLEDEIALEPDEMVEILIDSRLKALNGEFYPEEDRVGDLYQKFIARLTMEFQKRLVILGYIPGTFDATHVQKMLDHRSVAVAKHETIIPLNRRSMLQYNPSNKRFDIHGILRDCLEIHKAIKDLKPEMHRKYCKTFTEEMEKIQCQMDTSEYTNALAKFSLEHPNLEKLLGEVLYTQEDTYPFFIQVAEKCSPLIEKFMSADCEKFYTECLRATAQFGKDRDGAIVRIAFGSLLTNAKGDFPAGESYYRKALDVVKHDEPTIYLATVYQRLGWNLHVQWRGEEALSFLQKSLKVSHGLQLHESELCLSTLSSLGIVNTFLGNFADGKKYHFESLHRRKEILGENHPSVGGTHNNIGILYDQLGQHKKALFHFEQGLKIKKAAKAPYLSMSASYNNVALQYCELEQYDKALEYLDQAMENLNRPVPHKAAMGSTLDNYGKVYMKKGDLDKAKEYFKKALVYREEVGKHGLPHAETLKHLAQVYVKQQKYKRAIQHAQQVLEFKNNLYKRLPQVRYVWGCLDCLIQAHTALGDYDKLPALYRDIEVELKRLVDIFRGQMNDKRVQEFEERLTALQCSQEAMLYKEEQ